MELKITEIVNSHRLGDSPMAYYSASAAELGQDAGKITWENAKDAIDSDGHFEPLLKTDEQIENAKEWFAEFGAWDGEEIATWSNQDLNALLLQFIAGDIRESEPQIFDDYDEYQKQAERGTVSGRIYLSGEDWYIYIGC